MGSIYVSFNLKAYSTCSDTVSSNEELEKDYQFVYKAAAKFLYSHPQFPFAFSFSGNQIQFYKKRKNEFLKILRELLERDQIEVLGGGYYHPIFPLIPMADRSLQIEMLSTEIRQTLGKRPRGITLFSDCWDSSLVSTLQAERIEYVLLESSIITPAKRRFLPVHMSVLGKSVEILPYYDNLLPEPGMEIEDFLNTIEKAVERAEKKDASLKLDSHRIVNISFNHQQMSELLQDNWFDKLEKYLEQNETRFVLGTNSQYRKNEYLKVSAFIPSGINGIIKDRTDGMCESSYDLLEYDYSNSVLYNRLLYLNMLISQNKADKLLKKTAREKLLQAETGLALISYSGNEADSYKNRQNVYKIFMEVEKLLRTSTVSKEGMSCFDYDNNGANEYVCNMTNYFSYISLISGAVRELDIIKNTGNYLDIIPRVEEYDGVSDDYLRGLFVDHIFNDEQFENYINDKPAGNGIFSKVRYYESKFVQKHNEVTLCSEAVIPDTKQKISLRKKYTVSASGMMVQYIIKNESNKNLNVKLAVESSFANPCYDCDNPVLYNVELIDNDEILNLSKQTSSYELNSKGKLKAVDLIRLTDEKNGIFFAFEPNELCGYYYSPLVIKRPDNGTGELNNVAVTSVSTIFWDINLEPGKETEKTITFTITSVKKNKKAK